jgi:hypothetical protein
MQTRHMRPRTHALLSHDPSGIEITTEMDGEQERTAAVLLLDGSECDAGANPVPADPSTSSIAQPALSPLNRLPLVR